MDAEQEAVLRSMVLARKAAERAGIRVSLLAVQLEGEEEMKLPEEFSLARPLRNSTASRFGCQRALPFAADMIRTLREEARNADLHVMTNADIMLTPEFYQYVASAHRRSGFTGLNILKVLVPLQCNGTGLAENPELALRFARSLEQTHPGSDTFVWESRVSSDLADGVGETFLGFPPFGSVLSNTIRSLSTKFEIVRGKHLTYHIGGQGERGRNQLTSMPGNNLDIMSEFEAAVERTYPECSFETERDSTDWDTADWDEVEDDCDYAALNVQWSKLYKNCTVSNEGCLDADVKWMREHHNSSMSSPLLDSLVRRTLQRIF